MDRSFAVSTMSIANPLQPSLILVSPPLIAKHTTGSHMNKLDCVLVKCMPKKMAWCSHKKSTIVEIINMRLTGA
jgi:hypothetical protein